MNILDIRTVILFSFVINIVCILLIVQLWRQSRNRFAGTGFWVLDFVFQAGALVLVILRGAIPDWISMVLSNTMVIAGAILGFLGLERFVGKKGPQIHNYLLLALFIFVHGYFTLVQPSLAVRNLNLSVALLLVCFQCLWLLWHRVQPGLRSLTFGVGVVFGFYCLVSVVRIVQFFVSAHVESNYLQSGIFETLVLVSYQVLFILLTYSLVLMVNKRLLMQIRDSEARFRELFDKMKSGVAVYEAKDSGKDFVFRDFNHAAEQIEQVSKADVVGRSVLQIFPTVKEFGLFEVLQNVWKDGVARHHPVSQYKDGRIEGWRENYLYKLPSGEVVAIYDDVTESKKREEEIQILAVTDPLTGLYNRRGFMTLAEQQIKAVIRMNNKLLLLFIDIDDMKRINDTWGHDEGDKALVSAATILKQTFRESDITARVGGDEFAVLAVDASETTEIVLRRLADRIGLHNALPDRRYGISLSIGATVYDPQAPCSLDDLISQADTMMYEQKKKKSVES